MVEGGKGRGVEDEEEKDVAREEKNYNMEEDLEGNEEYEDKGEKKEVMRRRMK